MSALRVEADYRIKLAQSLLWRDSDEAHSETLMTAFGRKQTKFNSRLTGRKVTTFVVSLTSQAEAKTVFLSFLNCGLLAPC